MTLLAPVFFFYYIQSPLYSILQATGDAKAGMMNSVYGGIAKLGVMFILASQPGLQETGAVLAIGFGVLITSFLHIATLTEKQSDRDRLHHVRFALRFLYHDLLLCDRFSYQLGIIGLLTECVITSVIPSCHSYFNRSSEKK